MSAAAPAPTSAAPSAGEAGWQRRIYFSVGVQCPVAPEAAWAALLDKMRERITWDQHGPPTAGSGGSSTVTFAMHGDPEKDGYVLNVLEQKEGQQVLTFIFNLKFKEHVPQEKIDGMRAMLESSLVNTAKKTVAAMQ